LKGNIGQFDFMALCMNLVASIAMLSVASTVVESLMLYILPEKGVYRRYKVISNYEFIFMIYMINFIIMNY